MIQGFQCSDTEALFAGKRIARFANFEAVAMRKLQQLHAATALEFLRVPPGNQLEALKGDRKGQHSIRVNSQWRLCFVWADGHPTCVEIVDYHGKDCHHAAQSSPDSPRRHLAGRLAEAHEYQPIRHCQGDRRAAPAHQ